MKLFLNVCFLTTSVIFFSACHQSTVDKSTLNLQPTGQAWGALYQRRAAEYKALAFQAYNIAQLRLDQQLKFKSKKALGYYYGYR